MQRSIAMKFTDMWPESSINVVKLAKKLLQLQRYRIFPRGLFFIGTPYTLDQLLSQNMGLFYDHAWYIAV